MIEAIKVTEQMETINTDKAVDMFCDMCEIVLSAHLNEVASKMIFGRLPDESLRELQTGFDYLRNLAETVIQSRKK